VQVSRPGLLPVRRTDELQLGDAASPAQIVRHLAALPVVVPRSAGAPAIALTWLLYAANVVAGAALVQWLAGPVWLGALVGAMSGASYLAIAQRRATRN